MTALEPLRRLDLGCLSHGAACQCLECTAAHRVLAARCEACGDPLEVQTAPGRRWVIYRRQRDQIWHPGCYLSGK